MLTRSGIMDAERSLRDALVLSVYLDGTSRDPAQRAAWRKRLDHELERARAGVTERSEQRAFDLAAGLLHDELASVTGAIGAAGWVGFVTPNAVQLHASLPVPPALYVHWGRGMAVAPALRSLKESRPAIIAIVDSRSARLFRYVGGALEPLETLRAYTPVDPVSHMGAPPRRGFHSGTRGPTGTDAAERELRAGRAQMMREFASHMLEHAGPEGWLLLGGAPSAAHEASTSLPDSAASRVLLIPDLHLRSSDSQIASHAAQGSSTLRQREDLVAVQTVLERAGGGGRAEMRIAPVARALEAGAVQRLLLTTRCIEDQPERAETLVRAAFDEGADVEVVSGEGARLLNVEAEGVGALLRFAPAAPF